MDERKRDQVRKKAKCLALITCTQRPFGSAHILMVNKRSSKLMQFKISIDIQEAITEHRETAILRNQSRLEQSVLQSDDQFGANNCSSGAMSNQAQKNPVIIKEKICESGGMSFIGMVGKAKSLIIPCFVHIWRPPPSAL